MSPEILRSSPHRDRVLGDEMRAPDDVAAMLRLRMQGRGTKRIATELGYRSAPEHCRRSVPRILPA
jgi:hypothetical protein